MAEVTRRFKFGIAGVMIVVGAFDTIMYKTQNKQFVNQGGREKYFFHPFMQVAAMFLGEALALVLYFGLRWRDPEGHRLKQEEAVQAGKQLEFSKLKIAIPALCDCLGSNLQLFALNFTASSIYQMMRGGTIITTFIFSILLLNLKPKRYQMVGSFMAFVGIAIVGTAAMVFSDPQVISASAGLQFIGYMMLIASLFANGFQFTYEEQLFNKYHIEPLQLVGMEGCIGFITLSLIITILNFVPCSFGEDACAVSASGEYFIQQSVEYFKSVWASAILLIFAILGIFSITIFNVCSVSVTKYVNALARSICDVTRTVLIWLVGIIVTLTLGQDHQNYKWQSTQPKQIIIQGIGFVILILGNLLYNKILRLGCLQPVDEQGMLLKQQENSFIKKGVTQETQKQDEGE